MRLLIVEDSRTQCEALRATLERAGYEVAVALDGPTGIALATQAVPDLVISDVVMPGFDGYEVCRRLKADERTRAVPVMLLTSRSEPLDVVRALEAGADNFVGKPYEDELLLGRVRRTLARAGDPHADGVEIGGSSRRVASGRSAVLDVLVSTLEDAAARNAELAASKAAVDEAARQREQMLGVVAHELKNPLNTILLGARLESKAPGARRGKPLHELVLNNAQRMSVIIDDLLDMARIESGSFQLHLDRVNLSELIASVVDRQRDVANRAMVLNVEPNLVVRADATRLEQVLTNFLTNAFKYSPRDQIVTVRLESVDGHRVRTSVSDRGIGIEPDALTRVFERYFRSDGGRRTAEGIGVGLYLCKLLVRQHGGQVGVESAVGVGSTFWFELPRGM